MPQLVRGRQETEHLWDEMGRKPVTAKEPCGAKAKPHSGIGQYFSVIFEEVFWKRYGEGFAGYAKRPL